MRWNAADGRGTTLKPVHASGSQCRAQVATNQQGVALPDLAPKQATWRRRVTQARNAVFLRVFSRPQHRTQKRTSKAHARAKAPKTGLKKQERAGVTRPRNSHADIYVRSPASTFTTCARRRVPTRCILVFFFWFLVLLSTGIHAFNITALPVSCHRSLPCLNHGVSL